MCEISRRRLLQGAIETVAVAQLLRLAVGGRASAAPVAPLMDRWVGGINELARDLTMADLPVIVWQERIEALNGAIPMDDLLAQIDFDRVRRALEAQGQGEHRQPAALPGIDPPRSRCWMAVFGVAKGDAIPPHGHNILVTAHLILAGKFHTRTFDRVAEAPGRMTLRPTRDVHAVAGTTVSMSDDRDNVHWFVAEEGPAFTFDVGMRPPQTRTFVNGSERDGRVYLDPTARANGDGTLDAIVIDHATSLARFGGGAG